ncbi:MAG: DNA repair protein RadA [Thermosipho sp. (in: Bacteria)]|nr:DNA repair protein RadA [Thermosipho sp. (in: thermotogales)]
MTKKKTFYVCDNCGYESPKWFGKCPVCSEWNTAKEIKIDESNRKANEQHSAVLLLDDASKIENNKRLSTQYEELDTLLGGGIVSGQVILLGGEPGVGKSTLALQLSEKLSSFGSVLYVSGEESVAQIGLRSNRLNISKKNIYVTTENEIGSLLMTVRKHNPVFVIFDSVQTIYSNSVDGVPGGVLQIRTVVEKIRRFSKDSGIPTLLIAHVNKEGNIAGPKLVEHIVDTVIYFEGEKTTDLRILRVLKNRFGPSGEIAVFQMLSSGLKELKDMIFVEDSNMPGNVVASLFEGTRPILIQVQSLVSRDRIATARRISHGIDVRKIIILAAVISKHLNLPIDSHDIYVNVSGGLKITDPACDLAIASSILSSLFNRFLGEMVLIGEVGLDGSVRKVPNLKKRIENAKKAGYEKIIIPYDNINSEGIIKIKTLKDLYNFIIED